MPILSGRKGAASVGALAGHLENFSILFMRVFEISIVVFLMLLIGVPFTVAVQEKRVIQDLYQLKKLKVFRHDRSYRHHQCKATRL